MAEEKLFADRAGIIARLDAVIADRARNRPAESYTTRLLEGGPAAIEAKLREEAAELGRALHGSPIAPNELVHEAADLFYHMLVALASAGVSWTAVEEELMRRFGTSGLAEKASRGSGRLRPSPESE